MLTDIKVQAAVVREFGGPEVISVEEFAVPAPTPGEVRVRIEYAAVGPWDALIRAGRSDLPLPRPLVLGTDLAGVVEDVGPGVTELSPGDAVFGATNPLFIGADAQGAVARAAMLARRPAWLPAQKACAVPVVAVTALQMLELANVVENARVLLLGAAGNVGSWALELTARRGAELVGIVKAGQRPFGRAVGPWALRTELPPPTEAPFDVVLDLVGGGLVQRALQNLAPGGTLISAVGALDAGSLGRPDVQAKFFLVEVTRARLMVLVDLLGTGAFPPPIAVAEVMPLADIRRAHEMLDRRRPMPPGKLVLSMP